MNFSFNRPKLLLLCVMLLVIGVAVPAYCEYPERDITLIVPWSAGGGTDVITRYIGSKLENDLGKAVVVVNKTGGGGLVGFQTIANAKPDGYTLGMISLSLILQKYSALTYVDRTKYEPIALINTDPTAFSVNANSSWKDLKSALKFAKENPGKMRLSNSGPGAIWHINGVILESATGVKFTHVPYKGGNPAAVAVAGGHADATMVSPAEVASLAKAGKVKILAIASNERDMRFPDVPTFKEAGVDITLGTWRGLVAPAGTPAQIVEKVGAAVKKIIYSKEYKEFLSKGGFGWAYLNPKELVSQMQKNDEQFKAVFKKLKNKK